MASKDLTFSIFGRDVNASKVLNAVGDSANRLGERLDSFGKGSTLALGGLVGGSAAAGLAVAGSLGVITAGFIGAGFAMNATSQEVSSAMKNLSQEIDQDARTAAAPLRGVLTESIVELTRTSRSLRGPMQEAFVATIPAVESLTRGVDGFARTAMPGVVTAVKASQPVFRGLESVLIDTGYGARDFFTNISEGAGSSERILVSLGRIVRDALGTAGRVLADLSNEGAPSVERLQQVLTQLFAVVERLSASGFPVLFTAAGTVLDILSGVLAAVGPLADQFGTLLGVVISVAAAFRLLNGVAGIVQSVSGGFTGLVQTMRGTGDSVGAAQGKFAALASFAMGPLGIALGIAGIAFARMGQQQAAAARRSDDLAAALRASKGAIDDNVRSVAAKNLLDIGALDKAKQVGVSLKDVTEAYLGQGEAAKSLVPRLQAIIDRSAAQRLAMDGTEESSSDAALALDKNVAAAYDLIQVLGELSPEAAKQVKDARDLAAAQGESASSLENMTLAQKANKAATSELGAAYMTLQDNVGDASARLGALQTIMDKLTGRKAEYEEAVQALNDTFRTLADTYKSGSDEAGHFSDKLISSNGTIDTTTESGSRLQDTIVQLRDSTLSAADAMARNGSTQQEVQGYVQGLRDRFIEQADAAGFTRDGAIRLADSYGLIPEDITTLFFTPNLGDRVAAVGAFGAQIQTLPDGHVIIYADTAGAQGSVNRLISTNDGRTIRINVTANGDVWALGSNGQRVGMGARADGGPVTAGHPYLVGEEGPEIIIPGQSGMVHDAAATARMMTGSGGGGSITGGGGNHWHFHNHGVIGSQQQVETWLAAGIDSLRRKGRM